MPVPIIPTGLYAIKPLNVAEVTLGWRKNPEPDIKEYRVYRAYSATGAYSQIAAVSAPITLYVDKQATQHLRTDFYYKLTAVNEALEESGMTDPVTYVITARDDPMWVNLRNILLTMQSFPQEQMIKLNEIKEEIVASKDLNKVEFDQVQSAIISTAAVKAPLSITNETPGGVKDSNNQYFFTQWPYVASSLSVVLNGTPLRIGEDYVVIDQNSFRLTVLRPAPADTMFVGYKKARELSEAVTLVE